MEPSATSGKVPPAAAGFDETESAQSAYATVLEQLRRTGPQVASRSVAEGCERRGLHFFDAEGARPYAVDAVPRIIPAADWRHLARGVAQRHRAMNLLLADLYGEQRIVSDGVLPARVVAESSFDNQLRGNNRAATVIAHVAGPDLIHAPDGRYLVLEDNLRSPSGPLFSEVAADAVAATVGSDGYQRPPGHDYTYLLGEAMTDPSRPDGIRVIASDGPPTAAWFEHETLARHLSAELALGPDAIEARDGHVHLAGDNRPVATIHNRTATESLAEPPIGPKIRDAVLAGNLAVVNSIGTAVADDKVIHGYTDSIISYYLDEDPILAAVPSYDLGDEKHLARALARLDHLVIKPRGGLGGAGIRFGFEMSSTEIDDLRRQITAHPGQFVAQEHVPMSVHPTIRGETFEPRRIDLRLFSVDTGDGDPQVANTALTRFAARAEDRVVNSSQGGGAKATFVTTETPKRMESP